ncbi:MAG: hypothetical protein GF398_09130 [Chitinivibrionales bacterium]|nr:hypothetical protein [Chitinivibrionales bacterium]
MKKLIFVTVGLSVLIGIFSCGVSDKTLLDVENRIQALKNKGVPDSSLARAKVFLYQARSAKERGDLKLANMSKDSMLYLVAQAENDYDERVKQLRPVISSLQQKIMAAQKQLSGLPEKKLDSVTAVADSFSAIGWTLQVEQALKAGTDMIPSLKFNQERAQEIRPKVYGRWVCKDVKRSKAHPEVNYPEYKIFEFGRDNKVAYIEEGKGRMTTHVKMDYKFISNGTYDFLGDTIMIFVDRFRRIREVSEEKKKVDGKIKWVRNEIEPMDSIISDGSQNRWITYQDLVKDFKRQ